MRRLACCIAMAFALSAAVTAFSRSRASDNPVADFYAGKQIRMLIGYGEGGGYDLYARFAAEFLRKYIPGHPLIIPQNMPGAGSLKAAAYLSNVAPRDGTYLGCVDQSLALNIAAASENINLSAMHYIGRLTSNIDVGAALATAWFHNFDDARKRQIVVGVSLEASTAVLLPSALREYAGAKFKLVRGYSGAAEMMIALQRGEVELVGGVGLPLLIARNPDWIFKKKAVFLYQNALKRDQLLPNVPTLPELATSDEGRIVLRAISGTAEIGRSILTTPGVPADRLSALRRAFDEMVADPDFIAASKRRNIEVAPADGQTIDKIALETSRLPRPLLEKIDALTRSKQ